MIESMCVVCHGPVLMKCRIQKMTAIVCHDNCRAVWKRMKTKGLALPDRYLFLRWEHAYRRELEAGFARIQTLADLLDRSMGEQRKEAARLASNARRRHYRNIQRHGRLASSR